MLKLTMQDVNTAIDKGREIKEIDKLLVKINNEVQVQKITLNMYGCNNIKIDKHILAAVFKSRKEEIISELEELGITIE